MGELELWSGRDANRETGPIKQALVDLRNGVTESREQLLAEALIGHRRF